MNYFIKTFGCQMNHSDSERIAGFLEMHKIKPAKDINQANLIIFNTCGVRQSAEDRVYGQIHNLKKKYPKIKIVLTGCLANRKDVQRRLKSKVDLFCEIKDFSREIRSFLARHLELDPILICRHPEDGEKPNEGSPKKYHKQNYKEDSSLRLTVGTQKDGLYFDILPKYNSFFTAYIPIMTGCNNFCSYCVVPYARGPEVSRPAEEIISEVKTLIKNGYKEIILLGQNVNSYKDGATNFSALLKTINANPGNFWISFVSNHPKDFSDELIETATKLKKVCELIHLPIQAGSDEILQKMNRKYTANQYLTLINKVKKGFAKNKPRKLYAITSDIIVGFPGETKKQFLESSKIMEQASYDMVYFGQFSPRPGTAAYKLRDNVSKKEKERRENCLNDILKDTAYKNNKKYLGNTLEVLVAEKKDNYYFGHTRTMKNVKVISATNNLIGRIIKVKITKLNTWNLEALKK